MRRLGYGPGDLVVATTGGVVSTGRGVWHIDARPERLRAMCERLKAGTIDLYQLHRIDPDVPLADLRSEGKIRHIGLDTVGAEDLSRALEITAIASVQNRFDLLDREAAPVLRMCEERGPAFLPSHPAGPRDSRRGRRADVTTEPGSPQLHGARPVVTVRGKTPADPCCDLPGR
ncbi:aldo/keto reductase [Nonomuraea wenchangensis]